MTKEQKDRYMLLTRPEDGVLIPPGRLKEFYETRGTDPRVPKRAVGRMASTHYREAMEAKIQEQGWTHSLGWPDEVEDWIRPSHYPTHWGLSRIPRPDEMLWESWDVDYTRTVCYTSLNIPRPFDPHVNGLTSSEAVGFGYMYRSGSSWMDRFDIVSRRGGGNRGGFAMTTGPTEGNFPTSVLPTPTFDLGRLGYSDGGWNPEGLVYTNRPRKMRLTGLRSGSAHRVFMARSRQVMFRNVYGPIATAEATPRAPILVVNGMHNVSGILSVSLTSAINSPTEVIIEINNPRGSRTGKFSQYDIVQVYCSPRLVTDPPLVFTGFISQVAERDVIRLTCLDAMGYLGLEPLLSNPRASRVDAAQIVREVVGGSSYPIGLGRMITTSRITFPSGLDLEGKTRLNAVQTVLDYANNSPNPMLLRSDPLGNLTLSLLGDPEDDDAPLVGGRSDLPLNGSVNLGKTRDFWPTQINRDTGSTDSFNVVTVRNRAGTISETYPAIGSSDYPASPVHRLFIEDAATTSQMASILAEQHVKQQGRGERFTVRGRPERFDIRAGDNMQFFAYGGALTGTHRIASVDWLWSPNSVSMTLTVGQTPQSLIGSLRFAVGNTL